MNKYYPIFLNIKEKKCLVIGGGSVAYRKAVHLVRSGARVMVIAPSVTGALRRLRQQGRIELRERTYRPSDLDGVYLVCAATDNSSLNRQIFHDTRSGHALVNVVDAPEYCDFIMPAVIRRNKVTIAISTDGSAPYAAVLIKERIDEMMNPEYMKLMDILIKVRSRLLRIKKGGVDVDIEREMRRLSLGRLSRNIHENDVKSIKRYTDSFVTSCVRDRRV
ncbi:MAG: bifunctional precorrin-2 dehydrogenase/sirohydrochlorin ferrochelatase [Deltaproteobacteria bacterium]|nr:bifunctional precorrin-2 dehydrogenase/sirohydrochlorin ferrochelatase [Deltaproteobacteria bacterium]MCL5277303.1 bifunctional precorrin-2 dehydrogenase/sirohydrochlorin ferrochelatase [Deltaproteobacteria bacterium]